jgi:triosephosphate isomerase
VAVVIVNFKTYRTATGQQAVDLAVACEDASKKSGIPVIVVVQNIDLFRVSEAVSIPVFSEHMDPVEYGAHTGKVLPEAIVANGGVGVVINHSEDPTSFDNIKKDIERAKGVGLQTIICAPNAEECKRVATLDPDYVAMEPPELIGGDISVSKANPKLIQDTLWLVHEVNPSLPVLCGAGIKDHEDVRIAKEFGCEGILVASGVTKADDPRAAVMDLMKGFKEKPKR